MDAELKPCPFCGSHGALDECPAQGDWNRLFWVECRGEDCGIHGRIRYTAEAAIAAWNRRTSGVTADAEARYAELLAAYHEACADAARGCTNWQPIVTVPKDGREVILREGSRVGAACWVKWPDTYDNDGAPNADGGEGWTVGYDGDEWRKPTEWQPMPSPAGVPERYEPIGRYFMRDGEWVKAAPESPVGETLYRRTDGVMGRALPPMPWAVDPVPDDSIPLARPRTAEGWGDDEPRVVACRCPAACPVHDKPAPAAGVAIPLKGQSE